MMKFQLIFLQIKFEAFNFLRGIKMEITIKGSDKEITALMLASQGQQGSIIGPDIRIVADSNRNDIIGEYEKIFEGLFRTR